MSCEIIANGERRGCGSRDSCIADKQIGVPTKNVIRESVPYHNGTYDFSLIDGEVTFSDRSLTYVFGVLGDEKSVMQEVSEITTWLYSIHDTDIWDTDIPYWHFHGSCDSVSVTYDESGLGADITASFTVEPFMIADSMSEFLLEPGDNFVLNRNRRARISALADSEAKIITAKGTQTVTGSAETDLWLESGWNIIVLESDGNCLIRWREVRL